MVPSFPLLSCINITPSFLLITSSLTTVFVLAYLFLLLKTGITSEQMEQCRTMPQQIGSDTPQAVVPLVRALGNAHPRHQHICVRVNTLGKESIHPTASR